MCNSPPNNFVHIYAAKRKSIIVSLNRNVTDTEYIYLHSQLSNTKLTTSVLKTHSPTMSSHITSTGSERKRQKVEPLAADVPSSIIVKFVNQDGVDSGSSIDLPSNLNSKQLEQIINKLLENDEPLPYAFYINDIEVENDLHETLTQLISSDKPPSFEDIMTISYQPLSVFKVRPVTRCVETMPGHTDAVLHVSYSPDGKRLASGGGDMAVRFWNVVTSMPAHTCIGHRNHVLCTAWSPDGKVFVSADKSGEIRVWDPKTGTQKGQPMRGHSKWITSLAFEPLHLDPRCRRLASSSKDHTIVIWNIVKGQAETTISGHLDSVEMVKWGGTGLLYSCSRDRTIKVWAVDGSGRSQHKLVRTLTGHAHRVNSLALNCDYVLRTGAYELGDKTSSFSSQYSTSKKPKTIRVKNGKVRPVAVSAAVSSAAVGGGETTDEDIDGGGPRKQAEDRGKREEGSKMVEGDCGADEKDDDGDEDDDDAGSSDEALQALQARALERYNTLVGSDGERMFSCSDDFTLFLWKPHETKEPIGRMTGHQQAVNHIAFSPDGRFLASASFDKKVKLWCGKTGRFLNTLHGHVGAVYQVSWSPDSQFLVSASKDSTVKLWAVKDTKKAFATLPGHEDEVYTLDWSPGAASVASGSKDRTIKIWAR